METKYAGRRFPQGGLQKSRRDGSIFQVVLKLFQQRGVSGESGRERLLSHYVVRGYERLYPAAGHVPDTAGKPISGRVSDAWDKWKH